MKTYIIYEALNIRNQKKYIGFTGSPLNTRKSGHYFSSKTSQTKFANALRKYDRSCFEWKIIYSTLDKENALSMEQFFISHYDTIKNGYNILKGGQAGYSHSGSSNGMHGRFHSNEAKNAISVANVGRFKGKTYEEIYGEDKATILRNQRSESNKRRLALTGASNANHNSEIIVLIHKNGSEFKGTRFEFKQQFGCHPSNLLAGRQKVMKGWSKPPYGVDIPC